MDRQADSIAACPGRPTKRITMQTRTQWNLIKTQRVASRLLLELWWAWQTLNA